MPAEMPATPTPRDGSRAYIAAARVRASHANARRPLEPLEVLLCHEQAQRERVREAERLR
jgi:hypothetical protein